MISSDMRHQSISQSAVFTGQNKATDSGGALKSHTEPVRESRPSGSAPQAAPVENSLARLATRIDAFKASLDKILSHFPPFFPIGTYHRMDAIVEITAIQGEMVRLAAGNENLPSVAPEALSETSSEEEIMGALEGIFQFRAEAGAVMKQQAEVVPVSIKI
jgi:hypothetical protein